MSTTIAAIATPAAPAGLGVIRLSGDRAIDIASRVFRPAKRGASLAEAAGYTALYGHVFDASGDLDDCVAVCFAHRTALPAKTWWSCRVTAGCTCFNGCCAR